ncbi:MAG: hypothetical protein DRP11_01430 [Candidatus Aenigmatarchaeota archaeon]|nr:MAG: hypothetical protein DRP11_01430 [Candidatus Aenigmarchaeota archaeon]
MTSSDKTRDLEKDLEKVKVSPFEISLTKRDITDYIIQQILQIQNFAEYRYRHLLGIGLKVKMETSVDSRDEEDGVHVILYVDYIISYDQIVELAKRRKLRMLRLPKPHPLTKQKIREMEERAKEIEEELKESIEEWGKRYG